MQVDNAKDIDVVMPMYNLIEYSNNCSKTPGSLQQYYRDELALNNGVIANFLGHSTLFNFNGKVTCETGDDRRKYVKILVPLKYLNDFWRTVKMPLINSKVSLILTWSVNCVLSNVAENQETTFAITDTKLYVPVVTLSTDNNENYYNN